MRRLLCLIVAGAVGAIALMVLAAAALGLPGPLTLDSASAGVQSADVQHLGDRTADLLQGIVGPLIVALVGCMGVYAFIKRDVGIAVSLVAVAMLLGLFVFAPEEAEKLIEGFWERVS